MRNHNEVTDGQRVTLGDGDTAVVQAGGYAGVWAGGHADVWAGGYADVWAGGEARLLEPGAVRRVLRDGEWHTEVARGERVTLVDVDAEREAARD